ncbi:hypothetical protein [uncultured Duncaniella sp.]|uniref:hypothetical protein n=2 Tax=uncultured Duncaniella sp. TaxID=2768039 RepID=UPI0026083788|nr:hypothetical protein [uncultured Duncaniella sp.]
MKSYVLKFLLLCVAILSPCHIYALSGDSADGGRAVRGTADEMVLPRFILKYAPVDGGYRFTAECIDAEALEDFMGSGRSLDYLWGVKRQGGNIEWRKSESPGLFVADESPASRIWVYFKTVDEEGTESPVQTLATDERVVYNSLHNSIIVTDSDKLYISKLVYMYYDNGKIYFNYAPGIDDKYLTRDWAIYGGHVISPLSPARRLDSERSGFRVCDILPSDEFEHIKNNSNEGTTRFYLLLMLNHYGELIQYSPLTFTYSTHI